MARYILKPAADTRPATHEAEIQGMSIWMEEFAQELEKALHKYLWKKKSKGEWRYKYPDEAKKHLKKNTFKPESGATAKNIGASKNKPHKLDGMSDAIMKVGSKVKVKEPSGQARMRLGGGKPEKHGKKEKLKKLEAVGRRGGGTGTPSYNPDRQGQQEQEPLGDLAAARMRGYDFMAQPANPRDSSPLPDSPGSPLPTPRRLETLAQEDASLPREERRINPLGGGVGAAYGIRDSSGNPSYVLKSGIRPGEVEAHQRMDELGLAPALQQVDGSGDDTVVKMEWLHEHSTFRELFEERDDTARGSAPKDSIQDGKEAKINQQHKQALVLFAQAMEEAHRGGVAHLDAHAGNVMVKMDGDTPTDVKIIDFSLSRVDRYDYVLQELTMPSRERGASGYTLGGSQDAGHSDAHYANQMHRMLADTPKAMEEFSALKQEFRARLERSLEVVEREGHGGTTRQARGGLDCRQAVDQFYDRFNEILTKHGFRA